MKVIVYKTETGIAVISPAHGIAGAMKDIPKGAEYKIVDELELPKDQTYCDAWNYDFTIDAVKAAKIDTERAEAANKEAMPDIVKELQAKVQALEEKTTAVKG